MIIKDGVLLEVSNEDLEEGRFRVPDEVHVIGADAFSKCRGALTHVDMPNVINIGDRAFAFCKALTHVDMPNVINIGNRAFAFCEALTRIDMPSVTEIGKTAFSDCKALTRVAMPSVTKIRTQTFLGCKALTHVDMPSVTKVGMRAFARCKALTRVDMPSVTEVGMKAFTRCKALTRVDMPRVTDIGYGAFSLCNALTRVDMPSVINIGSFAFADCKALTRIDLPSLVIPGRLAFANCEALTHIIIGSDRADEIERIKHLLPEDLRKYVLFKSAADKQQEVINELFSRCFEYDSNEFRSPPIPEDSLSIISEFLEKPMAQEIIQVPYPRTLDELDGYTRQLQHIKEQLIIRHITAARIEKYIAILGRVHPEGLFAPPEVRGSLQAMLKKVIAFLEDGTQVDLSAEEKQWINKRPRLMQIIPQDIQEMLGIHSEPTPHPVTEKATPAVSEPIAPAIEEQQREAQENSILMSELDRILRKLSEKINTIGTHYPEAHQAACELYTALRGARKTLENKLKSGVNRQEAQEWFQDWCTQLVAVAMPELEKDKDSGWGEYLKDMLKFLANLLIRGAQRLGFKGTFFDTRSESRQSIAEIEQELQQALTSAPAFHA